MKCVFYIVSHFSFVHFFFLLKGDKEKKHTHLKKRKKNSIILTENKNVKN